uniref:Nacre protein n=1 Tax=Pinctada fucata TaxID=50426 RepID=L8B6K4_PINFU|nr:nacre protein [Pinctada fucata]
MTCTLRWTITALVLLGICHLARPAVHYKCGRYSYCRIPYDIERDRYDNGDKKCCYCRKAWSPWQCNEEKRYEWLRCGNTFYYMCCYTDDDNGNGNGNGNGFNYLKSLYGGYGNGNGEFWEEYIDERYDN